MAPVVVVAVAMLDALRWGSSGDGDAGGWGQPGTHIEGMEAVPEEMRPPKPGDGTVVDGEDDLCAAATHGAGGGGEEPGWGSAV